MVVFGRRRWQHQCAIIVRIPTVSILSTRYLHVCVVLAARAETGTTVRVLGGAAAVLCLLLLLLGVTVCDISVPSKEPCCPSRQAKESERLLADRRGSAP